MPDIEQTVRECFQNVFPKLAAHELVCMTQAAHADWDSVAHVTLIAALTEALGVELDFDAFAEATSYPEVLALARAAASL